MSYEGPQIRYAREDVPCLPSYAVKTPFEHALQLARQIEELLASVQTVLSSHRAYSVRMAQALSGSLIDQLSELASQAWLEAEPSDEISYRRQA